MRAALYFGHIYTRAHQYASHVPERVLFRRKHRAVADHGKPCLDVTEAHSYPIAEEDGERNHQRGQVDEHVNWNLSQDLHSTDSPPKKAMAGGVIEAGLITCYVSHMIK